MYLLHVVPIARGVGRETLSYFSSVDVATGSIVQVPMRRRELQAIVTKSEDVGSAKQQLKSADFALKKITAHHPHALVQPALVRAASRAAEYYASTTGSVLFEIIPKAILDTIGSIDPYEEVVQKRGTSVAAHKMLLQATRDERYDTYRSVVREEFARDKSVFVLVPTRQDAEYAHDVLSRGIEQYTSVFHSGKSKKDIISLWNAVVREDHPLLIIATGSFISLPRTDIGTFVIEREGAATFRKNARPFLDVSRATEYLAEELGVRLIRSGLPLLVDSQFRLEAQEYEEFSPLKVRVQTKAETKLVDMREQQLTEKKHANTFPIVSTHLKEALEATLEHGGRALCYIARRGLSPITVCQDCGNTVTCDVTEAPVVLHKAQGENVFVCHASGTVRSAKERCRHCGSWKLQSLGIGSELVEETLTDLYPNAKILTLSSDTAKTHAQATKIVDSFYATPGIILVATEMVIPYLTRPVEVTSIISIDSLLTIPEWNVYERVFSIILSIREITERTIVLQTRKPEQYVLEQALGGNLSDFYRTELEYREGFSYPPFGRLIRLSVSGSSDRVEREMNEVEEHMAAFGFSGRSHLIHLGRNSYSMHGFIRLPRAKWPDDRLSEALSELSPSVTVHVDPSRIL